MGYREKTVGSLRSTFDGFVRIGVLLLAVGGCCAPAAAQTTEFMELASPSAAGTQAGNGRSHSPQSNDSGRYVVFVSEASNLVANDTNGALSDVFRRDILHNFTVLVSVNSAGTGSGNGPSLSASISTDALARFVIFTSEASDLVAGDTNGLRDVFVRDLDSNTTKLVSVNSSGTASGNGDSFAGLLTPDGRYAFFTSNATDLVAGGTGQFSNVYRRDLQTSTTVLVSANAAGTGGGNGSSNVTAVTPDGRYVLFSSEASNIVANDTNGGLSDVFRRDLQTNTTALVSVNLAGTGSGDAPSRNGVMSDDGQVVAFESSATDLVAPGGAGTGFTTPSIYARDFAANTTALVSERQVFEGEGGAATIPPAAQPRISADGRYVFYLRFENFIGGLNRPGVRDRIFRRDRQTNELLELPFVATRLCEQSFNCRSIVPGFVTSRDGRYVAYRQQEQSRITPSTISTAIIVRDMVGGGAEVIIGFTGTPFFFPEGPILQILMPGSVAAGGKLAFSSGVPHSAADKNTLEDVYLFAPPVQTRLAFNRADYLITESGQVPIFQNIQVRRAGYLIDSTVTARFSTSDGTATSGTNTDYLPRSETLTFNAGETVKTVSVNVINDATLEPDETVFLTLSDPTGNAILGRQSTATLTIEDDDLHVIQFSAPTYEVSESDGSVLVTVTLAGNPAGPFTVDYRTADGTASERSDYITAAGQLHFAEGETSKTFRVLVVDDGFVEGDETVNLSLTNPQGVGATLGPQNTAQLTIHSNDTTPSAANPIDTSSFFVRQHYLDFLNREPDAPGFQFWVNEIEQCGANAQCREVKRINVSAAFFQSIEFQATGFLAYLTNKAAFGTRPLFNQFERDVQALQRDFAFGQSSPAVLEANTRAFFDEFVTRPAFAAKFGGMTNHQYVLTLLAESGLAATVPNIFVSRLEGQTPSQPGTTPPGVVILRRDPDASNTTVRLWLRLDTLTSAPTAVHIHGPATDGAPILHTLPAGEFADLRLTLTNEQIALLNSGQLIVDVHTQNNPNGELSARLGPIRFRVDVLTNALDAQTLTRAQVLRIVAESEELRRAELNRAFVLM